MATAAPEAPALPVVSSRRPRVVHTRTEVLGLLLIAAGMSVFVAVAALTISEELGFIAPMFAVPLVVAGLVWRFGVWAKILGLLAAGAVGFMTFWVVFGLSYPASFTDFVPAVLVPLGIALTLGGGVAGLVQTRRGRREEAATTGERRIRAVALGVAGLVVLTSGALFLTQRTSVDPAAAAGATAVTTADFEFSEETYEVAAGEPVRLVAHNSDGVLHTVTVPELGIDEQLLPGSSKLIELTAEPGTYELICRPHASPGESGAYEGMVATLVAR